MITIDLDKYALELLARSEAAREAYLSGTGTLRDWDIAASAFASLVGAKVRVARDEERLAAEEAQP